MQTFAEQFAVNYRKTVEDAVKLLTTGFKQELRDEGHVHTGKLVSSVRYEIEVVATSIIAYMYMEDYGFIVNQGVPANRIPYKKGSGNKSSKYIDGLIDYFKKKGLGLVESKRAAFATANKHIVEGMPTRGSFAYSNNGRRTKFVEATLQDNISKIYNLIDTGIGSNAQLLFSDFINRITFEVNG